MRMKPLVVEQLDVLSDTLRVVEIDIRKDVSSKCFGGMEFVLERLDMVLERLDMVLESLDMLRGWIASSI